MTRKPLVSLVAIVAALLIAWLQNTEFSGSSSLRENSAPLNVDTSGPGGIDRAFAAGQSDIIIRDSGRVIRVLADDNDGSRHQRFVVKLDSDLTVLIAHNIDVAPRIDNLQVGDSLQFSGEYEWNDRGGIVHWTHHDPLGGHASGWIKHAGRVFQ